MAPNEDRTPLDKPRPSLFWVVGWTLGIIAAIGISWAVTFYWRGLGPNTASQPRTTSANGTTSAAGASGSRAGQASVNGTVLPGDVAVIREGRDLYAHPADYIDRTTLLRGTVTAVLPSAHALKVRTMGSDAGSPEILVLSVTSNTINALNVGELVKVDGTVRVYEEWQLRDQLGVGLSSAEESAFANKPVVVARAITLNTADTAP